MGLMEKLWWVSLRGTFNKHTTELSNLLWKQNMHFNQRDSFYKEVTATLTSNATGSYKCSRKNILIFLDYHCILWVLESSKGGLMSGLICEPDSWISMRSCETWLFWDTRLYLGLHGYRWKIVFSIDAFLATQFYPWHYIIIHWIIPIMQVY